MSHKGPLPEDQEAALAKRVRELLEYDPETGVFRWRVLRKQMCAGDIAGYIRLDGYRMISIDGVRLLAHRLAFLYVYGHMPIVTDHINGIRDDNRIANLNSVDYTANMRNKGMQADNKSGVTGVYWHRKNRRWAARIIVERRAINLGYFAILEDAAAARKDAERRYGFSERHGSREKAA